VSPLDSLLEWLTDGAPGATAADVVGRIGADLRAHGVPVDRLSAFITTLHPSVAGRAFRWSPGEPVHIAELPHGVFETGSFRTSAVAAVHATKKELRVRIDRANPPPRCEYPIVDELASEGFTDYVVLPFVFTDGQTHAVTVASKAPRGFSDDDLVALRRVLRPLARVAEILALRRTASNLLSTYVGRNAGDLVLAGHIQKGDFETIRAAIWFSDLRGFTDMSCRLPARDVIDTLNRVFGRQVASIERHGGEVLKFMGDGMLAIFPFRDAASDHTNVADATRLCDRAIEAAEEALSASVQAPDGTSARFGLALHIGELAYGNIGGENRLDFTAIGPAVNLAARLEGLTAKLGRPLVLSEAIARLTTRHTEELGTFQLKGIAEPVRAFAPSP
jgi:adenylate cyclase